MPRIRSMATKSDADPKVLSAIDKLFDECTLERKHQHTHAVSRDLACALIGLEATGDPWTYIAKHTDRSQVLGPLKKKFEGFLRNSATIEFGEDWLVRPKPPTDATVPPTSTPATVFFKSKALLGVHLTKHGHEQAKKVLQLLGKYAGTNDLEDKSPASAAAPPAAKKMRVDTALQKQQQDIMAKVNAELEEVKKWVVRQAASIKLDVNAATAGLNVLKEDFKKKLESVDSGVDDLKDRVLELEETLEKLEEKVVAMDVQLEEGMLVGGVSVVPPTAADNTGDVMDKMMADLVAAGPLP